MDTVEEDIATIIRNEIKTRKKKKAVKGRFFNTKIITLFYWH